eukprot:6899953-Prymnesium_polylepis.1
MRTSSAAAAARSAKSRQACSPGEASVSPRARTHGVIARGSRLPFSLRETRAKNHESRGSSGPFSPLEHGRALLAAR